MVMRVECGTGQSGWADQRMSVAAGVIREKVAERLSAMTEVAKRLYVFIILFLCAATSSST